jgi:DNA polymerase II large subunit
LQIKEGEIVEEILESTPTKHGLPLETLEVMVKRWKSEIDKEIHNMTIMMYYVLHAFYISLW